MSDLIQLASGTEHRKHTHTHTHNTRKHNVLIAQPKNLSNRTTKAKRKNKLPTCNTHLYTFIYIYCLFDKPYRSVQRKTERRETKRTSIKGFSEKAPRITSCNFFSVYGQRIRPLLGHWLGVTLNNYLWIQ